MSRTAEGPALGVARLIPIASIIVGVRRRKNVGDVDELKRSIREVGLVHPLVIDDENNLVSGERRLTACKALGWEQIPAVKLKDLPADMRRRIELEENLGRSDYTPAEQSRTIRELVKLEQEAAERVSAKLTETPKEGRPPKERVALATVAAATGIPEPTLRRAKQHADGVDRYPFMESWPQEAALKAAKALDGLPEKDRKGTIAILEEPGVPRKAAETIIENVQRMDRENLDRTWTLAKSEDKRDQDLAVTSLAKLAPLPDPRLRLVGDSAALLKKAHAMFPHDPCNEWLALAIESVGAARKAIKEIVS